MAKMIPSICEGNVAYIPPQEGDCNLIEKTVTKNGIYRAFEDGADGYSVVTANVPNTYDAADEGKVVSDGELVAQTRKTITQNGTYDTTLKNEVVVSLPTANDSVLIDPDLLDEFPLSVTNLSYGFPIRSCVSIYSSDSDFNIASYTFDGVSAHCLHRKKNDVGSIFFLPKVEAGKYSKLKLDIAITNSNTGQWTGSYIAFLSAIEFQSTDKGWISQDSQNKCKNSVYLAGMQKTTAWINAQTGVVINSTDGLNLAAQTVEIGISDVTDDFYVGFVSWWDEPYIRKMWLE